MVFRPGHDGEVQYDHFSRLLLRFEVWNPQKEG